jgi:hypothetical protein
MTEERPYKPSRKKKNIQFARSLSYRELSAILQNALMEARNDGAAEGKVELMPEIVHDIKFRLRWYYEEHGEVKREKDDKDDED